MVLLVLDTDLKPISIVDIYESFIWTDRYYEYGDFELYTSMNDNLLDIFKQDYYLQNLDSEHAMIIEKLRIETDVEEGNHLTVSGRSLESILKRRIIWGQKSIKGNLQNGIKTLLDDCIISPSNGDRKIDNFIFEASDDEAITGLTLDAQYTGDNLYNIISGICQEKNIGFKITINDRNQFVFKLYAGADRSYNQTKNPYVVFSPTYDNIVNSNYVESRMALYNVTLVGGEGEGAERRYATVGSAKGLGRREIFTDARDISSDVGNGVVLSDSEYYSKLEQRGKENLAQNKEITSFEGEAETNVMYKYGVDFFNGDIVQIANEYGHETSVRVIEIVMSESEEGLSVYPTFTSIEKGDQTQ